MATCRFPASPAPTRRPQPSGAASALPLPRRRELGPSYFASLLSSRPQLFLFFFLLRIHFFSFLINPSPRRCKSRPLHPTSSASSPDAPNSRGTSSGPRRRRAASLPRRLPHLFPLASLRPPGNKSAPCPLLLPRPSCGSVSLPAPGPRAASPVVASRSSSSDAHREPSHSVRRRVLTRRSRIAWNS